MKPGWNKIDSLVVVVLAALAATIWLFFRGTSIDDAYITYRYAANVADGLGLVYNPGDNVLSTTSTLYAVVLGLIARFYPDIPTASNLLSSAAIFGASAVVYLIGRRFGDRPLGFVAALTYALAPFVVGSIGMETNFYLFLVLSGFLAYCHRQYALTALFLTPAFLTRADAAIPIAILGIYHLIKERRVPVAALALALLMLVPFVIYLTATFGTPLPVTLSAKQAQLKIGWSDYVQGLLDWLKLYVRQSWLSALIAPMVILGLVHCFKQARWLLFSVAWAASHVLAYQWLGVASYFWYYAPLVPAMAFLCGAGASFAARRLQSLLPPSWQTRPAAVAFSLALLVAAPAIAGETVVLGHFWRDLPDARAEIYTEVGNWLRENTPEDATVGVMEVGIMGYYAQRRTVDFLGLIEPDSIRALQHKDIFWSVYHYQPDYLVLTHVNPLWGYPIHTDSWFKDAYRPVKQFNNERFWNSPLVVYQRLLPVRPGLVESEEVNVDFDGRLTLVKSALDRTSLRPGEYLTVALYWQKTDDNVPDHAVTAQLIGEDGRLLAQDDVTTATTFWRRDQTVQYYHHIKVPDTAAAGRYRLCVAVYPPSNPMERLPLRSGCPCGVESIAVVATVEIVR